MKNIVSEFNQGKLTLSVIGEIDHHSAKEIRREVDAIILDTRPEHVYIDLSCVTFMDSSGLGLIMGRYALTSELGVTISVLNPTDSVARIILMAGLEKIVPIERRKHSEK